MLCQPFHPVGTYGTPSVSCIRRLSAARPVSSVSVHLFSFSVGQGKIYAQGSTLQAVKSSSLARSAIAVHMCCEQAQTSSLLLMAQLVAQSTVMGYFIIDRSCVRITVRRFIFASFWPRLHTLFPMRYRYTPKLLALQLSPLSCFNGIAQASRDICAWQTYN